jgi:peptidyl-prolyl cis-trans isomerase A (cyclophilin A)
MKLTNVLLIPAFAAMLAPALSMAQTGTQAPATKPAEEIPDAPQATAAAMVHPNGPTVVMDTSMGRITCQLYQQ